MRKICLLMLFLISAPVWAQEWTDWGKKIVFSDTLKKAKKITSIEKALENPEGVYYLELTKTDEIKKFTEQVAAFKNLRKLVLLNRNADDIVLPDKIWTLVRLEYLLVFNFPGLTVNGIRNLKKIKYLGLDGTGFKTIPPEIFELKNLELLDLSCNQLTFIPPEIVKLRNLVELEFTNNCFTEIPQGIVDLPQLKYLTINNAEKGAMLAGGYTCCNNSITQFLVFLDKMKNLKNVHCFFLVGVEKQMKEKIKKSFPWIKFD